MISDRLYNEYLRFLLQGKRADCGHLVQNLLDQGIEIKALYTDLFQKSLYTVGELWESNKISVAKEHLASAITEGMLNLVYPHLFKKEGAQKDKKVVISCAANEYHQIGAKMVADIFEIDGWDSHFLGANTPANHMLAYIQETNPDLVALSLSVYANMPSLKSGLEAIRSDFINLDIFVGGQAFRWGGIDAIKRYKGTEYIHTLDELETRIKEI